jgi:hypothetical protein
MSFNNFTEARVDSQSPANAAWPPHVATPETSRIGMCKTCATPLQQKEVFMVRVATHLHLLLATALSIAPLRVVLQAFDCSFCSGTCRMNYVVSHSEVLYTERIQGLLGR